MTKRTAISPTKRAEVFRDNGGVCYLCKRKIAPGEAWEVEHVKPVGFGGTNDASNLRPAHQDCHKPKTADDVRSMRKADRNAKRAAGIKPKGKKLKSRNTFHASPSNVKRIDLL